MRIETEVVMERKMRKRGNKYAREDSLEPGVEDGIITLEEGGSEEGN